MWDAAEAPVTAVVARVGSVRVRPVAAGAFPATERRRRKPATNATEAASTGGLFLFAHSAAWLQARRCALEKKEA
jgi:hypothetical protein